MKSGIDNPPVHRLYSSYLDNSHHGASALDLWGNIPATMGGAYKQLVKKRKEYITASDALEDLKKVMKRRLREMGVLTSRVVENIDNMDGGVVEAGQQPYCLGGSSLILNKIAHISILSGLGDEGFVPLFYVADYDGVHPELTNIRLPSPSSRGLLIKYPAGPEMADSPIYTLPNPPEDWLKRTFEKIKGNYKGLLRREEPHLQDRLIQNLSHSLTILKNAYHSTENVSDWSMKTLGCLINLEADLGVPILSFSMPGTRRLFQPGYEFLLREPNRSKFIEATNTASDMIERAGYRPQIGLRAKYYVPFFLECISPGCNRTRLEMKYIREHGSSKASITGKCLKCAEVYEFSFNAGNPDLSDIVECIGPRVDSRQVVVNSVIPVLAHVGGPGETSYYAEVIPTSRVLRIPFPIFLRYTRTFYNTPWNERRSKGLRERRYPTLTNDGLFSALSSWVEARNAGDGPRLSAAHSDIRARIEGTYNRLLESLNSLHREVDAIKGKLREPGDKAALIKEMRDKLNTAHDIENYLSSAFGRFSPEHFGQEVSWSWLDLSMVSGIDDLLGIFLRQYNENTPNSSMFFVNL